MKGRVCVKNEGMDKRMREGGSVVCARARTRRGIKEGG